MCANSKDWYIELPMTLLILRVSYREYLKCSAAVFVYDQGLRIPEKQMFVRYCIARIKNLKKKQIDMVIAKHS